MPQFRNRENPCHILPGNRLVWESRSVAVVTAAIGAVDGVRHVLLARRGPGCPDEVGKLCLPGGYLDWDETAVEAAIREVWEETGLDITGSDWDVPPDPWFVASQPRGRQNITLAFSAGAELEELPRIAVRPDNDEITEAGWVLLAEAVRMDLAYAHAELLQKGMDQYALEGWGPR